MFKVHTEKKISDWQQYKWNLKSIICLLEHSTHTLIVETYTLMVLFVIVLGLRFFHFNDNWNILWEISYLIYR